MQRKTVHEIVPFRFPLLLSSNGRSGIKREHSEGSYHDNDDDDVEEEEEEDDNDELLPVLSHFFPPTQVKLDTIPIRSINLSKSSTITIMIMIMII